MARKRIDPVSRTPSGARQLDAIVGKDPRRHYVLVNPNDEWTGVGHYEEKGYEIEIARPGGPRPRVRSVADGGKVMVGNQILMSCSMETWKEHFDEGQRIADIIATKLDRGKKRKRIDVAEDGSVGGRESKLPDIAFESDTESETVEA